jgi:hypothetical protein
LNESLEFGQGRAALRQEQTYKKLKAAIKKLRQHGMESNAERRTDIE